MEYYIITNVRDYVFNTETKTLQPLGKRDRYYGGLNATPMLGGRAMFINTSSSRDDPDVVTCLELPEYLPLPEMPTHGPGYSLSTLDNGRILSCGGKGGGTFSDGLDLIHVFDNGRWELAEDRLPTRIAWHKAIVLPGNRVLFMGGWNGENIVADCMVYEVDNGVFKKVASMHTPRVQFSCVMLPDGRIMVTGGRDQFRPFTGTGAPSLTSCEIYDPVADTWTPAPPLINPKDNHASLVIGDQVLVFSGWMAADATKPELLTSAGWIPTDLLADRWLQTAVCIKNRLLL